MAGKKESLDLAIVFSLKDEKGSLRNALKAFEDLDINLTHIESRRSKSNPGTEYDIYTQCVCAEEKKSDLLNKLDSYSSDVKVVQEEVIERRGDTIPWYPRTIYDLQRCCTNLFKYGDELAPDHPGFGDETYVERRRYIAKVAKEYS